MSGGVVRPRRKPPGKHRKPDCNLPQREVVRVSLLGRDVFTLSKHYAPPPPDNPTQDVRGFGFAAGSSVVTEIHPDAQYPDDRAR